MDLFPLIFQIVQEKEASMSTIMVHSRDQLLWQVNLIRVAQNWKIDSFESLFSFLYAVNLRLQDSDALWWTPTCNDLFSVYSYYKILTQAQNSQVPLEENLA